MSVSPVIFVVGPSGAGKSTIADWVATDLKLLHFDSDSVGGIRVHGLGHEWKRFRRQLDPAPLLALLRDRVIEAGSVGAVVSFPSTIILSREQIDAAKCAGITTAVVYGSEEHCREAFLARERANGRGLDSTRWDSCNKLAHPVYGQPEYANVRIEAFRPDGSRWPRHHMVATIVGLLGDVTVADQ